MGYFTFISHASEDKPAALALKKGLEQLDWPFWKLRARRVFVDQDNLGLSGLKTQLHDALRESESLLVLCSNGSARSRWVDDEIRYWRTLPGDRPLLLVTRGELAWPAPDGQIPPALREAFTEVPLYFDLACCRRLTLGDPDFRHELARAVATVQGGDPEVLLKCDARRRRLKLEVLALALVTVAWLSTSAYREAGLADTARLLRDPGVTIQAIEKALATSRIYRTLDLPDQALEVRLCCALSRTLPAGRLRAREDYDQRLRPAIRGRALRAPS